MKVKELGIDDKPTGRTLFVKESPRIYKQPDEFLNIQLEASGKFGTFLAPASNFGGISTGDFIDAKFTDGNTWRFLVTSDTQDYVSRKGTISLLCHIADFGDYLRCNIIPE